MNKIREKRMGKELVRSAGVAFIFVALVLMAGCSNKAGEGWEKSGRDEKRGIDHYYLKSSVKPLDKGCIRVKTKLLSSKGDKAVEKATNVEKAFSIEVEGVIYCDDSAFMVLSKEYLDKQGISLKVEKDGGNMEAVVKIKKGEALHPMIQQVCKEAATMKPVMKGVSSSAQKKVSAMQPAKPTEKPVEKKGGF